MLAALAGADPKGAHALVTDLLSIAGITAVGGRSVGEIADRFLEQAALGAATALPRETREVIEKFLAISGDPDDVAEKLRALASDVGRALNPAIDLSKAAPASSPRAASTSSASASPPPSAAASTTTPASNSSCTIRIPTAAIRWSPADAMTGCSTRLGAPVPIPAVGFAVWIERLAATAEARHERSARHRGAVERPPAGKRRSLFRARRAQVSVKPRGAREYRGAIAGLDNVEVAYLSAADITSQLAQGAAHLGITGEDLVREMIPDAEQRVVLLDGVGFGYANVVVAVPQAWIDVRGMADLDDVATAFRARNDRKMRVATKYVNLTRGFFAAHGIVDYRIVESLGATEGAPAAGSAELIVDITTTGATLAANGLKVIEDGIILRSQANLVASRQADWNRAGARNRAHHFRPHDRASARGVNFVKCAPAFSAAAKRPCLPR